MPVQDLCSTGKKSSGHLKQKLTDLNTFIFSTKSNMLDFSSNVIVCFKLNLFAAENALDSMLGVWITFERQRKWDLTKPTES